MCFILSFLFMIFGVKDTFSRLNKERKMLLDKRYIEHTLSPHLEQKVIEQDLNYFPNFRPLDHTMGYSLDKYVEQRIPTQLIEYAISTKLKIKILALFPEHFKIMARKLNLQILQDYYHISPKKKGPLNKTRPEYFLCCDNTGEKFLVVAVSPGSDYVDHYASMIRHQLNLLSCRTKNKMTIIRFPFLEETLTEWSGLDNYLVKKDEIVILGYVNEIEKVFQKSPDIPIEYLGSYENYYYRSRKYKVGKKIINLLGVKYSFWGNLSGFVVNKCCILGAAEVIYAAKLGALSSPKDLYDRLYSATDYVLMRGTKVVEHIKKLRNPFIEIFKDCHTLTHVSVPTVLEEDFIQRKIAGEKFGANSIDNEIFYMAKAISEFNRKTNSTIKFFSLHFATDYIRHQNEATMTTLYDLTNNRTESAIESKSLAINNLANKLIQYLTNKENHTLHRRKASCY